MTVIATSCWARTSSGLRGISVVSIAPSCIRRVTTAHSSRSPRYFGKMTPLLGAPTWWPARPTRWRPRATLVGLSTWMTRSTAPMSMPELERARGDERRQPAGLELLLDREALLAGDAAVVGPDQLLAGELVEPLGEPLGEAPAVDEDDRAAVRADQLEDRRVDRRPDARPAIRAGRRATGLVLGRQDLARCAVMSSTGTMTWRSSGLRAPASTIRTSRPGPTPAMNRPIASSGRCVADRPIRCGGARVGAAEALEPLQAEREVRAALRAGDRVDLVDDHVLDAAQHLAGRAGEHQVERFGGRDQDVRRRGGRSGADRRPACRRSGTRR